MGVGGGRTGNGAGAAGQRGKNRRKRERPREVHAELQETLGGARLARRGAGRRTAPPRPGLGGGAGGGAAGYGAGGGWSVRYSGASKTSIVKGQ